MSDDSPRWTEATAAAPRLVRHPSLLAQTLAVATKELQCEFRTRYALSAVALFAVTAVTLAAWAIPTRELSAEAQASVLWMIVFFASMSGLQRAFVREEETRTADALRLSAAPMAVFLGKWFFNLALLLALEAIVTILFVVFMHGTIARAGWFAAAFVLGDLALVSVGTALAPIVARARSSAALFTVICFPLLVSILKAAVGVTAVGLGLGFTETLWPCVQTLVSFTGMMLAAAAVLFEFAWRE